MTKLQILVATMNRTDLSLRNQMNITCDAVIANQCPEAVLSRKCSEDGLVQMITTGTKGVGRNRNIALLAAEGELLLFADDDLTYYDGTAEAVVRAFEELPQADVILFGIDMVRGGRIIEKRHLPVKRRRIYNSLRYGTCSIAARKDALLRGNIVFSQHFGGGSLYGSGEDTLFLCDCFRKGLKVYSHSHVLGQCNKDTSSWFTGYNEKFFFDKGALFGRAFPRLYLPMMAYMALRMKKRTALPLGRIFRRMWQGAQAQKRLEPFSGEQMGAH